MLFDRVLIFVVIKKLQWNWKMMIWEQSQERWTGFQSQSKHLVQDPKRWIWLQLELETWRKEEEDRGEEWRNSSSVLTVGMSLWDLTYVQRPFIRLLWRFPHWCMLGHQSHYGEYRCTSSSSSFFSSPSYTTLNVSWECDLHNCRANGPWTWHNECVL